MKKNAFLTFICACVPGCGQMYLGYMKRGTSLLLWFIASIAIPQILASLTSIYTITLLCLLAFVSWAYSFFDTFNLRNLLPQQQAAMKDEFLPGGDWFTRKNKPSFKGYAIAGWFLIALGVIFIFNILWDDLYRFIWNYSTTLAQLLLRAPALLVGVIVIIIGIVMLRGHKKMPNGHNNSQYNLLNAQVTRDEQ
jgi:hypothetical protein